MNKSLVSIYKIPFLISVVLALALLGTIGARQPWEMVAIFIGTFLSMFILDLEYFLNAYVLDTKSDFSKTLVGFVGHSDWVNALKHVHYNKEESTQNSLNSALFQIVLAFMSIFVVYSTAPLMVKALVLGVFAQSIYVLTEYYFKNRTDDWFWALTDKPSRPRVQLYIFVLLIILSYCLVAL